jgi:hypothetical protein
MTTGQLQRTTFSTSRLLDFASLRELTAETGHGAQRVAACVLQELIDNVDVSFIAAITLAASVSHSV